MTAYLAIQALLIAVWRLKATDRVSVPSDQGAQFSSCEWQSYFCQHNLDPSMNRRGNCHDSVVAEILASPTRHFDQMSSIASNTASTLGSFRRARSDTKLSGVSAHTLSATTNPSD